MYGENTVYRTNKTIFFLWIRHDSHYEYIAYVSLNHVKMAISNISLFLLYRSGFSFIYFLFFLPNNFCFSLTRSLVSLSAIFRLTVNDFCFLVSKFHLNCQIQWTTVHFLCLQFIYFFFLHSLFQFTTKLLFWVSVVFHVTRHIQSL